MAGTTGVYKSISLQDFYFFFNFSNHMCVGLSGDAFGREQPFGDLYKYNAFEKFWQLSSLENLNLKQRDLIFKFLLEN